MKIRTKIKLYTIVSLGLTIGITLLLFNIFSQAERANKERSISFKIVNGVFELNMLTYDYLLNQTGRAQTQWRNLHESIAGLLVSEELNGTEEAAIVYKLHSQHNDLRIIFTKLVRNHRKRKQLTEVQPQLDNLDNRLVALLSITSQSIVLDTNKLLAITRSRFITEQQRVTLFIVISVIILSMAIISFAFIIHLGVIRPINRLQRGTEIIGQGNLTHKIDIRNEDEVGDLAKAFNNMSGKLKESYSELEEKISQRTKELTRSNEDLDNFAYVVSHDLKAPLRAIHNYADFLQKDLKGTLEEEQEMYLEGLGESVKESEKHLEDVLQLSRVGKHKIMFKNINIGLFLHELIALLHVPSNVEITLQEDWPTLKVEPTFLRQIFQNLILNGLKFNKSVKKRIDLGCIPKDNYYEIFVKDNGIGIEARFLEKIFKPFQKLHTSEEYEGSGIGLATVSKAVNRLEWMLRVESKPDNGSTFFITIPKT